MEKEGQEDDWKKNPPSALPSFMMFVSNREIIHAWPDMLGQQQQKSASLARERDIFGRSSSAAAAMCVAQRCDN